MTNPRTYLLRVHEGAAPEVAELETCGTATIGGVNYWLVPQAAEPWSHEWLAPEEPIAQPIQAESEKPKRSRGRPRRQNGDHRAQAQPSPDPASQEARRQILWALQEAAPAAVDSKTLTEIVAPLYAGRKVPTGPLMAALSRGKEPAAVKVAANLWRAGDWAMEARHTDEHASAD